MSRTLEITVISAENLRVHRKPVGKKAFAVVKIDPFNVRTSSPDESNGSYPTWNEKFEMEMSVEVQFISVEVFHRTGCGRVKKIGNANIPVTDFMGRYAPEGHLNFLSYRLWDEWGDRNGIVNVSVEVKSNARFRGCQQRTPAQVDLDACASQAAGFWRQVAPKETGVPLGIVPAGGFSGRTVTGVPFWCAFQKDA